MEIKTRMQIWLEGDKAPDRWVCVDEVVDRLLEITKSYGEPTSTIAVIGVFIDECSRKSKKVKE